MDTNSSLDLRSFSRRDFLKLSGSALLAILAHSAASPHAVLAQAETSPKMGRIVSNLVDVYDSPSLDGKLLKTYWKDLVLPITQITMGSGEPAHNRIWYEMNHEGYVHSGSVQPVQINLNKVASEIPEKGVLAEVTVPYTDACWNPIFPKMVAYRLYYETTHWVTDVIQDSHGQDWYQILEDFYQFKYYVNASHLRIIPAEEVSLLSPDVPAADKKLVINLEDQIVIAYEGDTPVQMMRCSAGIKSGQHSLTPTGSFTTDYKRPSRHMVNGNHAAANTYDLPGVPWVSFLNEDGISFHGTFWHNDFGKPRSHGCINLPSSAAKWVYRWTTPSVPYQDQTVYKRTGTLVEINE